MCVCMHARGSMEKVKPSTGQDGLSGVRQRKIINPAFVQDRSAAVISSTPSCWLSCFAAWLEQRR